MSPEVIESGPEALRGVLAADVPTMELALLGLDPLDLTALGEAAHFLYISCRVAARGRGW